MKLLVLLGSARKGGLGQRVGQWVTEAVKADSRFELDYVGIDELGLPAFNEEFSPKYRHYTGHDYTNAEGKAWAERVGAADAFLFITPEYNHGYPGGLKNVLDWVGGEWQGKAVGFVGYSMVPYGGVRAVEQLRQVVTELGLHQVLVPVLVGNTGEALSEAGVANSDELNGSLKTLLEDVNVLATKLSK